MDAHRPKLHLNPDLFFLVSTTVLNSHQRVRPRSRLTGAGCRPFKNSNGVGWGVHLTADRPSSAARPFFFARRRAGARRRGRRRAPPRAPRVAGARRRCARRPPPPRPTAWPPPPSAAGPVLRRRVAAAAAARRTRRRPPPRRACDGAGARRGRPRPRPVGVPIAREPHAPERGAPRRSAASAGRRRRRQPAWRRGARVPPVCGGGARVGGAPRRAAGARAKRWAWWGALPDHVRGPILLHRAASSVRASPPLCVGAGRPPPRSPLGRRDGRRRAARVALGAVQRQFACADLCIRGQGALAVPAVRTRILRCLLP